MRLLKRLFLRISNEINYRMEKRILLKKLLGPIGRMRDVYFVLDLYQKTKCKRDVFLLDSEMAIKILREIK